MSAVSKDKVLMPTTLTAENGAKAALTGKYHNKLWVDCPECHYAVNAEECELCLGEGGEDVEVPVSWTTIKQIYKDCVELFKGDVPVQKAGDKPAMLPGERFRIQLSGDDIYVFISYNNGTPWEIFATAPCSWLSNDPRKGYMGAINRLAALSLQSGTELSEVVDQLSKSSAGNGDYPGVLAGLLMTGDNNG